MGSQKIQGELWGKRSKDWASIQEATGSAGYKHVLQLCNINSNHKLLDVGCGSGFFSNLAQAKGANVTGIDASAALIEQAKERNTTIDFLIGEMEDLPFADNTFDIVCAFNSFQYAESIKQALIEAKRALKDKGNLVVMIWGNKEDCEVASTLKAIGSLIPPPLPGATGPFALTENQLLEKTLEETGLRIIDNTDVVSFWDYPNTETAIKGLISAGTVVKAIDNSSYETVYKTIATAIQPYIQQNGHVVYKNKWRIVISEKQI